MATVLSLVQDYHWNVKRFRSWFLRFFLYFASSFFTRMVVVPFTTVLGLGGLHKSCQSAIDWIRLLRKSSAKHQRWSFPLPGSVKHIGQGIVYIYPIPWLPTIRFYSVIFIGSSVISVASRIFSSNVRYDPFTTSQITFSFGSFSILICL